MTPTTASLPIHRSFPVSRDPQPDSNVVPLAPRLAARLLAGPPVRPGVLIRAARAGQPAWRRERDLPPLMRAQEGEALPGWRSPGAALSWLRQAEQRLDTARRERCGDYDVGRHVALLIALLHELRLAAQGTPA